MKTLELKQALYAICVTFYALIIIMAICYVAGIGTTTTPDAWQKALAGTMMVIGCMGMYGYLKLMEHISDKISMQQYQDKVNEHEFESFLKQAMPRIVAARSYGSSAMQVVRDPQHISQAFDDVANWQAAENLYWADRALQA